MTAIPVIDMTPARTTDGRLQVAKEIGAACEDTGFFVVTGHGVPEGVLDGMYEVSRAFFALPEPAKRLASASPPDPYRGYTSPLDHWADGSLAEQLEKFEACTFETPQDMAAAGYAEKWQAQLKPNIWPPAPAGMADAWHAYLGEMHELGDRIMRLMAVALGLPEHWLSSRCTRACSFLVANHYLPARDDRQLGRFRLQAHTDIEALTVLYQDTDVGGLQVHTLDGEWEDVPVIPGAFICNLGDMMAKWSNDRWAATPHRVKNSGEDRISIPFFHGPDKDCLIEAIPTCVSDGRPAKYPPVYAGDWTQWRMGRLSRNGEAAS